MTTKNLKPETRALIVRTGYQLQAVRNNKLGLPLNTNTKVKYEAIREEIGNNHNEDHNNKLGNRAVKRWWNKRQEFQQTGSLEHAKRTGRPLHPAFATEEKRQQVIDKCYNLEEGEHQQDVMDAFGIKCKKTLTKHTPEVVWVLPPKEHEKDDEVVKDLRVDYARWGLTETGRLTNKVKYATFVDHKKVTFFGWNKRHFMQAKPRGANKSGLIPLKHSHHATWLMGYFACNISGVASLIHDNKRRKKRGRGYMVDTWKIDHVDVMEAYEHEIIPFMNETGSDYVIADGVPMNHAQEVRDLLEEHEIRLHPSACRPHCIDDGYPACSHPCMPLDFRAFAPYQKEVCAYNKEFYDGPKTQSAKQVWLYDDIEAI